MNIAEWNRAQPAAQGQPRRRDVEPQIVTARWNGVPTSLIIEAVPIYEQLYLTFRPVGAPQSEAFVVGDDASAGDDFGNSDKRADAFGYRSEGALAPFKVWPNVYPNWLADAIARIERGWWGRVMLEEIEARWGRGVWLDFYGASGISLRQREESTLILGMMMMERSIHDLADPKYDPDLRATPWCNADRAPALLMRWNSEQLADWMREQEKDATTPAGFARAWKSWSHAERRSWLPPLEREIEDEICRAMEWIYWSAPEFERPKDFPRNSRAVAQWFRPRFIVAPDAQQPGEFLLGHHNIEPSLATKWNQLSRRLHAFWPLLARAFADERVELSEQHAALPPSIAHWCFRRGCYNVTFEVPKQREIIESRAALRDWLRFRAKTELEIFERSL